MDNFKSKVAASISQGHTTPSSSLRRLLLCLKSSLVLVVFCKYTFFVDLLEDDAVNPIPWVKDDKEVYILTLLNEHVNFDTGFTYSNLVPELPVANSI